MELLVLHAYQSLSKAALLARSLACLLARLPILSKANVLACLLAYVEQG
jgi:hypothetical protein